MMLKLIIICILIIDIFFLFLNINIMRKISIKNIIIKGFYYKQPKKMTIKTNPKNNKKKK